MGDEKLCRFQNWKPDNLEDHRFWSTSWTETSLIEAKFKERKTVAFSKWTLDLSLQNIWIQTGSKVTHSRLFIDLHTLSSHFWMKVVAGLCPLFCTIFLIQFGQEWNRLWVTAWSKKPEGKGDILFVWFSKVTGKLRLQMQKHATHIQKRAAVTLAAWSISHLLHDRLVRGQTANNKRSCMERASPEKVGKRCPKGALWANDNGKWALVEGYWKGDWRRRNARSSEMCAEWEAGEE